MSSSALIALNLVVPSIAGLFFCFFSLYFLLAGTSRSRDYRYFIIFLVSFAFFLLGRPIQILSGEHPLPLIINNIRLFILCTISIPALALTTGLFKTSRGESTYFFRITPIKRVLIVVIAGSFFGIVYALFNTLGTVGSYPLFIFGNFTAFDSITPSFMAPFFGREVTQSVQICAGIFLIITSIMQIREIWREFAHKKRIVLINIGVLIFGISFIMGTILKEWSMYYLGSILSVVLISGGVLSEIREMLAQIEIFTPFIREDIIKSISLFGSSADGLADKLALLGKKKSIDTFIALGFREEYSSDKTLQSLGEISELLRSSLDEVIGEESYIIFPLSGNIVGVAASSGSNDVMLMEIIESIRIRIARKTEIAVSAGMGRRYCNLENLRLSYCEAINALEFASKSEEGCSIHIDTINNPFPQKAKYPFKEKEELLQCVRLGDTLNASKALNSFFSGFREFSKNRPDLLKVRMYELTGALIDSAVSGGADSEKLYELGTAYLNEINHLSGIDSMKEWIGKVVEELVGKVASVHNDRSSILIARTRSYMEKYFSQPITVEEVAREIKISPSYFLHLFKEKSDCTFSDYLTDIRIRKAKELLLKTTESITSIAFGVGYNDSNYFSTVFKNHQGITPSEYRKQNRAK